MSEYQHLRGFLHSDSLRWSYGAVKGRDPGWLLAAAERSPEEGLVLGALAGFDVLWLDRAGYDDRGAAVDAALQRLGLGAALADVTGRREAYSLAPVHELLGRVPADVLTAARAVIQEPVVVRSAGGLEPIRLRDHGPSRRGIADAALSLANTSAEQRSVDVRLELRSLLPSAGTTVTWPDGTPEVVGITPEGVTVMRRLVVPPGGTAEIGFRTDGPSWARTDFGPIVIIVGPVDVMEEPLQSALDAALGPAQATQNQLAKRNMNSAARATAIAR